MANFLPCYGTIPETFTRCTKFYANETSYFCLASSIGAFSVKYVHQLWNSESAKSKLHSFSNITFQASWWPPVFSFSFISWSYVGASTIISCWGATAANLPAIDANASSHVNTSSNERHTFTFPSSWTNTWQCTSGTFIAPACWYARIVFLKFSKHRLQSDIYSCFQTSTSSHRRFYL